MTSADMLTRLGWGEPIEAIPLAGARRAEVRVSLAEPADDAPGDIGPVWSLTVQTFGVRGGVRDDARVFLDRAGRDALLAALALPEV